MDREFLFIILIAGLVIWFWIDSMKVRESVLRHCKLACERIGVQLLDQTVVLRKLRLSRKQRGQVMIERHFTFEFSSEGEDRHTGVAVMQGNYLLSMYLESYDSNKQDNL